MEQVQLIRRFERALSKRFREIGRCLLAVSGGGDSMAMAAGCVAVGAEVEIACLDHQLRPESAEEVRLVTRWANEQGVRITTRQLGLVAGPGVEARARVARYAALREIALERGFKHIATAHTASDQAETVLMRLFRGTSSRGASGIHAARRDGVVRPLLFATRDETQGYVLAKGIPHVRDPMNEDSSFLRVRLRRDVLPAIAQAVGYDVVHRLAQFARYASEDEEWLSTEADRALERVRVGACLDRTLFKALGLPIQRRVLAAWFSENGLPLDGHHLSDARQAVQSGRNATLPHDRMLEVGRAVIAIVPAPPRLHGSS